jgi:hypothetical protein
MGTRAILSAAQTEESAGKKPRRTTAGTNVRLSFSDRYRQSERMTAWTLRCARPVTLIFAADEFRREPTDFYEYFVESA